MTLPFMINGARAVIPAVYDYLRVQDSLPAPTPAGRNLLIIGEGASGVPSNLLDLQLNYFTDYNSVLAYYKSGPIVDAARQIFSAQPSVVFGGSVNRLYVYKTNNTTRAEKAISSPSNYGKIVAAEWNEDGNLIRSQIKSAQAEVKPSVTCQYVMSPASAVDILVGMSGQVYPITISAEATPTAFVAACNAAIAGCATGGELRSVVTGAAVNATIAASGSVISLTFVGTNFSLATVKAGDTLVIPHAGGLAGSGLENSGTYVVESVTASTISARKVASWDVTGAEVDYVAPAAATVVGLVQADQADYATADFMTFAPVVLSNPAATLSGTGATMEIADDSIVDKMPRSLIKYSSWADVVSASGSLVGDIEASVASGSLVVSVSGTIISGAKVGDVAFIDADSPIAGASKQNVGFYLVSAVGSTSLTLKPIGGSSIAAVSSVAIGGVQPLKLQAGFVTSSVLAQKVISSAEYKVFVEASRAKDNSVWPVSAIGGNPVMEISYALDPSLTAVSMSIDHRRRMVISFTGGSAPAPITINTLKYRTVRELVEYINTLSGFSARVVDSRYNGFLSTVLDMVSGMQIMSASALPSYVGRIKKDYYDWKQSFADNSNGILAFSEGSMLLKCGLPAPEAVVGYLSGATVGFSTNADFSAGLDAGMKINCLYALPLVSRDAIYDIEDGLTDSLSSYTIDSIHAMVKAHVATASSTLIKRERYGMLSFHGSFADSKEKASVSAYERTQMAFQMPRAVGSTGDIGWFQPWMFGACVAAGRTQAVLGTSMLRKSFNVSDVKHIGNESIYSDTLTKDFDPEDHGMLSEAIEAGLLCFKFNPGYGVQMVSPDLSTRSRMNDPQGWVWERVNVLATLDEVRQVMRSVLENYIGARTTDVAPAVVATALQQVIDTYVSIGALKGGKVNAVKNLGNQYFCEVSLQPVEALEAIAIQVTAERGI
jgi:hypothetical protein